MNFFYGTNFLRMPSDQHKDIAPRARARSRAQSSAKTGFFGGWEVGHEVVALVKNRATMGHDSVGPKFSGALGFGGLFYLL